MAMVPQQTLLTLLQISFGHTLILHKQMSKKLMENQTKAGKKARIDLPAMLT